MLLLQVSKQGMMIMLHHSLFLSLFLFLSLSFSLSLHHFLSISALPGGEVHQSQYAKYSRVFFLKLNGFSFMTRENDGHSNLKRKCASWNMEQPKSCLRRSRGVTRRLDLRAHSTDQLRGQIRGTARLPLRDART